MPSAASTTKATLSASVSRCPAGNFAAVFVVAADVPGGLVRQDLAEGLVLDLFLRRPRADAVVELLVVLDGLVHQVEFAAVVGDHAD